MGLLIILTNKVFNKPFVILDLETSGIDPKQNDIIEVALIRYENGKEVDRYDDIITINYDLPPIITAITGITDKDIEKYGKPKDFVLGKVEQLIKDTYLVGHNIKFDYSFLKENGVHLDLLGTIDTIPLAQILIPQATSYSLGALTDDLDISHKDKHSAMADVEATLDLFKYLWNEGNKLPSHIISEIQGLLPRADWNSEIFFESLVGGSTSRGSALREPTSPDSIVGARKPLSISEVFGPDGSLKKCMDGFETRSQQVEMADNVLNAFEKGYHLICEAPTGIGKSLAYLSAAANISISNKSKVVISTNTVNLQQQLFEKDIPLLKQIYKEATGNEGVSVAVLKGRSHYLCLRRLTEFKRRTRFTNNELVLLIKIIVWEYISASGDSSEIHLTREDKLIWDFELSADGKFCSPIKCKAFGKCYLHEARKKAEDADIVIVNHALLCAALESDGGLLPDYQYLIIDEAHNFEDVATRSFGIQVKQESLSIPIKTIQNHLDDLRRRFEGQLFVSSKAFESIDPILDNIPDLQQLVDNFFNILSLFVNRNVPSSGFTENLLIDPVVSTTEEWVNIGDSLSQVHEKLMDFIRMLKKFAVAIELAEEQQFPDQADFLDELTQEIGTLSEQLGHLNNFFKDDNEGAEWIKWISSNMTGQIIISLAPSMIGPFLKDKLYDKKKSIILTSATLGVKLSQEGMDDMEQHPFTYLRKMMGLDESFEELILDTPFDYESQVYIITPNNLESVKSRNSIHQVSGFMKNLIRKVGGGILGLFTSHGALSNVYLNLMKNTGIGHPNILAQRISGGRAKIFKAYMNNPKESVLLGTNSFWEGIDISGEALTTLVIHKLPFDVPNDPIYKVRSQMFNNGFMEFTIPRAILKFRQGFGRLIRSTKDYGVLVVLDNRVIEKEFGRMFLKALPDNVTIEEMKLESVPDKVKEWLDLMKMDSNS